MEKIKLGIIREGKVPPDKRVPLTPLEASELMRRFMTSNPALWAEDIGKTLASG